MSLKKPVVLTILDGWGYRPETFANAVALARKPTYDKLLAEFPNSLLHASDHFVGLPDGQMGNSEVGHLNIGSGRVVHMDITRIDDLIRSGEFFRHPVIVQALKHAGEKGRALHLLGLVSDGGVHSQQEHLHALLLAAKQHGVERVFVHAFLDGRDTLPTSGVGYLEKLQRKINEIGVGKIASVGGRYFAMDRDRRWEREKKAFDAMVGTSEAGVCRSHRAGEGVLPQRRDGRVRGAVCGGGRRGTAGGPGERWRCLHLLQLSRRPGAADHACAGAQQRADQK